MNDNLLDCGSRLQATIQYYRIYITDAQLNITMLSTHHFINKCTTSVRACTPL